MATVCPGSCVDGRHESGSNDGLLSCLLGQFVMLCRERHSCAAALKSFVRAPQCLAGPNSLPLLFYTSATRSSISTLRSSSVAPSSYALTVASWSATVLAAEICAGATEALPADGPRPVTKGPMLFFACEREQPRKTAFGQSLRQLRLDNPRATLRFVHDADPCDRSVRRS